MNKQARMALLIALPFVCAFVGFFGMRLFLASRAPQVVLPDAPGQVAPVQALEGQSSGGVEQGQTPPTGASEETTQSSLVKTPSEEQEQASEVMEEFSFPGLSSFAVQVGSYGSLSNADSHRKKLIEAGYPASVFSGKNHKVVVGAFPTREEADLLQEALATDIPDAFVTAIKQVPTKVVFPTVEESTSFALQQLISRYVGRLQVLMGQVGQADQVEASILKDWLKLDKEEVDVLLTEAKQIEQTQAFSKPLQQLILHLERDQAGLNAIDGEAVESLDLTKLWIETIYGYGKLH